MEPEANAELKVVKDKRNSFFKELLTRRVPQFLGGYLAASWIIVEFLDWLVNRYPLSPYLVEFGLVAMASLIPTVALIAYFHGKPGRDRWTITEKIGIPSNLIITILLLFFIFQGKELGATTTTVTVTSENGEEIERVIPKSEFRKRIAMFPFENNTGDTSNDWMKNAMPDMIQYDLIQDLYMDMISPYSIFAKIEEAGLDQTARVPMALKKKITGELHMDYYSSGTISELDGQLSVKISLHDGSTSKSIAETTITSEDIFTLVDKISNQLKVDLEIPKQHVQETEDMPISEMMTYSLSALEKFYKGNNMIVLEDNWPAGIELVEQSIEEDDAFAVAYLNLYMLYLYSNQSEKFVQTFEPLMQHLYKIPERFQFAVKHDYYQLIKQDPEMAMNVAKNWVELYPDDLKAHTILAMLYQIRSQTDKALEEYKTIMRLDPGKHDLLIEIGDLYKDNGDFDLALNYYNQYLDKYPNSLKPYMEIGNLYKLNGDYENAKKSFNEALLIEPDDLNILLSMADIELELGQIDASLEQYNAALESSKTEEERIDVYQKLERYYMIKGQVQKSNEVMESRFSILEKIAPPLAVIDRKSNSLDKYILAGQTDVAFQLVKDAESILAPPMDKMIPFLYLTIYLKLEDVENSEKYLGEAKEAIEALQLEIIRHTIFEAQGKIHELKGEYDLAIDSYMHQLELEPTNYNIHVRLGRCYRQLKDFDKSKSSIRETISIHPFWPKANYELALVYAESGNIEKAIEYLEIVEEIWEDADPDYKPAIQAREKLTELQASL